jgi:hypothetical protein
LRSSPMRFELPYRDGVVARLKACTA